MKKASSVPKSVDEYLSRVPEPARSTLQRTREVIRSAAPPEATEGISYGMPALKYKGSLMYFAAFKNHCSLFPGSGTVIAAFEDELKGYHTSKGTLRFPWNKPLPSALVKKIVKPRVARSGTARRNHKTAPGAYSAMRALAIGRNGKRVGTTRRIAPKSLALQVPLFRARSRRHANWKW